MMSRIHLVLSVIVFATLLACSRQTGATDGDIVTIEKSCHDAGCGWSAHPQLSETAAVTDACVRSTQQLRTRCSVALTSDDAAKTVRDCKQFAQTHGEGAIPWLACRGAAPCETPAVACDQTSTFGDELCASPAMSCSSYCTDTFRLFLDEIASRLKPAMLAAAKTCATQELCGEATACMSAWLTLLE
jgi:hypothetical protein